MLIKTVTQSIITVMRITAAQFKENSSKLLQFSSPVQQIITVQSQLHRTKLLTIIAVAAEEVHQISDHPFSSLCLCFTSRQQHIYDSSSEDDSSSSSISTRSSLLLLSSFFCNLERYQSCKHIKASTVFGLSELRLGVITFLLKLNADSEATLDTGIARISCAILANCGYLAADLLQ